MVSDADRFAAQDTAHDLCEVNCGRTILGVECPVAKVKGLKWKDGTITVTLSELEARAIRSAIQWSETLAEEGKLELFDYQFEAFDRLKDILK